MPAFSAVFVSGERHPHPCDQYFEAGGVVESVVDGLVPVVLPGVVLLGGVVELDELEEPDAELSVDVEGDGIGVAGGVVVLDGLVVGDGLLVDGVVMRSSLARSQPTTVAANAPATNNAARGRI